MGVIADYHWRTAHRLDGYAHGPATIDWNAQPNPYRHYLGAPSIALEFVGDEIATTYAELVNNPRPNARSLSAQTLSSFFELSFGLSAWKQMDGERWALRCNPSSGNLHPSEAYAVVLDDRVLAAGVYHYVSLQHQLETRASYDTALHQAPRGFLLALSSIAWREAWKYGERAYRYCQLDIGHAVGAVCYAAALHGWRVTALDDWSGSEIERLIGLDRRAEFVDTEQENGDVILWIDEDGIRNKLDKKSVVTFSEKTATHWHGQANTLDPQHFYEWPIIGDVIEATRHARHIGNFDTTGNPLLPKPIPSANQHLAVALIKQRRSGVMYDGETVLPKQDFLRILDATLPRPDALPHTALNVRGKIHFVLFVHRVEDFAPGLYLFVRDPQAVQSLKTGLRKEFSWQDIKGLPDAFPLYTLLTARCERAAATLSCHQAIAAKSAFSLSMITETDSWLSMDSASYPKRYHEAGLLGQILYLEAEAAGVRGTGIGCFFDDAVQETIMGKQRAFAPVNHFAIGTPLSDPRITTLSAYHHLPRKTSPVE